ncbi:hypothetical protein BGZ82_009741 [Podila clonocystis]|nr:hypothetical protein BGZ82_009741 [Podila clonocystis]
MSHKPQSGLHYESELVPQYPQQRFFIPITTTAGTYLGPQLPKHAEPATIKEEEHDAPVPLLFQPLTVKNLTLTNRFMVAPMCMYSCKDGFWSDFHLAHLGSFAIHGAGLIIAEASAVQPRGRISAQDSGIWSDDHIPGIKRVADMIHAQGSKMGIQLAHAGRKASLQPLYNKVPESDLWLDDVVAPTGGLPWSAANPTPREMSVDEIRETVQAFGQAAIRAHKAGLDMVEIHGAHGYLIHNFLSPVTNRRTDQYGGSLENRARFLLEVIREVRAKFPAEKPISLRVSATDWVEHLGGDSWEIEQTVEIAKWARDAGVDILHVSSGGNVEEQRIDAGPSYQVPFAERIKKDVPGLVVVAVGIIVTGNQAEEILQDQKADLIAGARIFLREPNFVFNAAKELNVKVKMTAQYERGRR